MEQDKIILEKDSITPATLVSATVKQGHPISSTAYHQPAFFFRSQPLQEFTGKLIAENTRLT